MKSLLVRQRAVGAVAFISALGLLGAACAAPVGGAPPSLPLSFRGTSVTVTDNTEFSEVPIFGGCGFTSNCYDEPYLVNIWFRVKIGVPNSAMAGVVSARGASPEVSVCQATEQPPCAAGSQTEALVAGGGGSGAQVDFANVSRPDVFDLANPANAIEVTGVWSWHMEEDWVGSPTPDNLATILQNALNGTLAQGSIPQDTNQLAQIIIDDLGSAIALGGGALADILTDFLFGIGDDLIGSRMYVMVGSSGTLAGILDAAAVDLTGFNLDVQSIGIPDIDGVSIRSTNPNTFTNQATSTGGAAYSYDYYAG